MGQVMVIVGPTASGKTALAVELARRLNAEVVSADSMQIYQNMRIGTAVPTEAERQGIRHHMLEIVPPDCNFSVAMYQKRAFSAISDILSRKKMPIVAGGTGLYVSALTYRLDFTQTRANDALRQELSSLYDTDPEAFHERLRKLDAPSAQRIHLNDKKRLIRRLEILMSGESREYDFQRENDDYDFMMIGINRQREQLYAGINARVDAMVQAGLLEEATQIYRTYGPEISAFLAIGYKEFLPYFRGERTLEAVIETIKQNTRRFAKRQMTWFKRDKRIAWYDADEFQGAATLAQKIIEDKRLMTP